MLFIANRVYYFSILKTYRKIIVFTLLIGLLMPVLSVELGFYMQQKAIKKEVEAEVTKTQPLLAGQASTLVSGIMENV